MTLIKKTTASIALVTLLASTFATGVSAYSSAQLEAANALAAQGIINSHSDAAGFNLDQNVLRQEIAAVARGVAGLEKTTTVMGTFSDVTATTPNNWAVYSVEALADAGLIAKNAQFNPERNISKAEALGMMVKAAGLDYAYDSANSASWQAQVVAYAVEAGIVSNFSDYDTSATRGWVFSTAVAAQDAVAANESDDDLLGDLLGGLDDETDTTDDTTDDVVDMPTTSEMEVSLSATTPDDQDIPKTSEAVTYLSVDVAAGNEDVTITSISLKRSGLGSRSDINKVWAELDGVVITGDKSINSDDEATLIVSPAVTVKAGSTETIDIVASMQASSAGSNNALTITEMDTTTNVGGLPVVGNTMRTTSYTVTAVTLDDRGSDSNVDVSDEGEILGEFSLYVNSSTDKDALFKSLRLKNQGSANLTDLENLAIYKDGEMVSTSTDINGDYVTFRVAGGYLIEDGDTRNFEIKGDIISGDDADTIKFVLKDNFDLKVYEVGTGFASSVTNSANEGVTGGLADYTLNAGKFTVSKDITNPSAEDYAKGSSDVTVLIAKIDVDQKVKTDGLKIYLDTSSTVAGATTDALWGTKVNADLEKVRLYVDGNLVDSLDSLTTSGGNNNSTLDADEYYYDFDSSFEMSDNSILELKVNIASNAIATNDYKFTFDKDNFDSVEYVSTGDSVAATDMAGSATGNSITIASTNVTLTRNDGYSNDETFVAGTQGAKLMQFVINGSSSSVTKVKKLVITNSINDNAQEGYFTNVKIMANGSQVGDTEDLGTSGSTTFDGINFEIAKSGQATFALYADVDSAASDDNITFTVDKVNSLIEDGEGDPVSTISGTSVSPNLDISAGGTLTVSVDGNTADEAILISGSSEVEVASYKFTAKDDTLKIKDLYLANNYDLTGDTAAIKTLTLDAALIAADEITIDVNGVTLTETYAASSDATLQALATQIQATEGVATATVTVVGGTQVGTDDRVITVTAATAGDDVTLANGTVTGATTFVVATTTPAVSAVETGTDDRFGALKLKVNGSIVDSRVPTSGKVHFDLGSANAIEVAKNQSVVVTVVADTNVINDQANTNKQLQFALYAVEAFSKSTGTDLATVAGGVSIGDSLVTLGSAPTGKEMVIAKTAPTVATQAIANTNLTDGADVEIYKFTVTADSAGDVALKKFTLQLSGGQGGGALADADFDAWKVQKNGTDQTITPTENLAGGEVAFVFTDVQTIAAGTSKTFSVKSTLSGFVADGDSLSASIKDEATANAAAAAYATVAGTATNSFVWSDNSGTDGSLTDLQWMNGKEVNGLDTTPTNLNR